MIDIERAVLLGVIFILLFACLFGAIAYENKRPNIYIENRCVDGFIQKKFSTETYYRKTKYECVEIEKPLPNGQL